MGFYIRKSFSVGPLRFNLSKSGIGTSVGVKGLRLGTGPRGSYIHMGRGGLYYRSFLSTGTRPTRAQTIEKPRQSSVQDGTLGLTSQIESSDLLSINESSSDNVLSDINQKHRRRIFWPWFVAISVILTVVNFQFWPVVLLVVPIAIYDHFRKRSVLIYSVDDHADLQLQRFYEALDGLVATHKAWHLVAEAMVLDKKYHAGADHLLKRQPIKISYRHPRHMKTNVKVLRIPVGKRTIYLFPDRLLIFDRRAVAALQYASLQLQAKTSTMIEGEGVPKDTPVVGNTWKYINKSGGPDRRFSNNPELPKVHYAEISFTSSGGLNERIMLSNPEVGAQIASAIRDLTTGLLTVRETT